jgi:hypothetical protein
MWMRVGDIVHVAGSITIATDAGQADATGSVPLSLPIVDDGSFVFTEDTAVAGVVADNGHGELLATFGSGAIDGAGDEAVITIRIITNLASNGRVWYSFMYDLGQMEAP